MDKINREAFQFGDFTRDPRVVLNLWNLHEVEGLNMFYEHEDSVFSVAIIDGGENIVTINNCIDLDMPYTLNPSFNMKNSLALVEGVEIRNIVRNRGLGLQPWADQIKLMNHRLSYNEVTRILDHMAVWNQVSLDGLPCIVLESGTVLYKKIQGTMPRNTILSLDNSPTINQHNTNYLCMTSVHAYAIDQYTSRALFLDVLTRGIIEPLELMFRLDHYCCLPMSRARRV
jgi:hypothetical protein